MKLANPFDALLKDMKFEIKDPKLRVDVMKHEVRTRLKSLCKDGNLQEIRQNVDKWKVDSAQMFPEMKKACELDYNILLMCSCTDFTYINLDLVKYLTEECGAKPSYGFVSACKAGNLDVVIYLQQKMLTAEEKEYAPTFSIGFGDACIWRRSAVVKYLYNKNPYKPLNKTLESGLHKLATTRCFCSTNGISKDDDAVITEFLKEELDKLKYSEHTN